MKPIRVATISSIIIVLVPSLAWGVVKSFGNAMQEHQAKVQQRLDRLTDAKFIPEDKKTTIREDLQAELTWLQSMQQQLQSASPAERQALQGTIRQHAQTQRAKHEQILQTDFRLPDQSPAIRAKDIGDRYAQVIDTLQQAQVDTTDLSASLQQYNDAVQLADSTYQSLTNNKTIEQLHQLQQQLQIIRSLGQTLRNQIQSLLPHNNLTNK